MIHIFRMAFRDLGRNRRRSFFSALALGMGLGLLILMAAVIAGEMRDAISITIKLQSGHLQVRVQDYNENKSSLAWEDLVENPDLVAAQIAALAPVKAATPRLYANGIITSGDRTVGVRMIGVDPASEANAPYVEGLVEGEFITAGDREGIVIGQPLADKLDLKTGGALNLLVNNSNGDVDEQLFIIRGIYNTHTPGYDELVVFLPLTKAQAFTQTENHASAIFVLLNDKEQAPVVKAALQAGKYQVLDFEEMNFMFLSLEQYAGGFMYLLYLIVLGITATVIVNTLIMAVFERTREIGILSAIGMKGGRIMSMFFAESFILAVGGILIGMIFGGLMVAYFAKFGFYIGNMGITGMLLGERLRPLLTLNDVVTLSIMAFIVTLLAALYPAWLAARMEPVQALRGGK